MTVFFGFDPRQHYRYPCLFHTWTSLLVGDSPSKGSHGHVRRILNPNRATPLEIIERALARLGKTATLTIEEEREKVAAAR